MEKIMSEMATVFGRQSKTKTKIERYGWTVKDSPGEQKLLSKNVLNVHPAYQRRAIETKIKAISAEWSWVACGALIVGERSGEYWVIDGQHRALAAKRRADIDLLPCIVFETERVEQEAKGFLDANTGRKPVSSIDKFRASIAAGDQNARHVDSVFKELGITTRSTTAGPMQIKSVAWAMRRSAENREAFESVMRLAAEMCTECPLHEIFLDGLHYIHTHSIAGLENKRLRDRIIKIGAPMLVESAKRAASYFARGGAKVWADGMLAEINKGLRDKIILSTEKSSV